MRKLTLRQFETAVKKTRKDARTIKMAKEVLVDGESASQVARTHAASRQLVANAVYLIYDIYLESVGAPEGWIEVKEFFPPKEAKEIQKRAKELLVDYNKKRLKNKK